MSTATETRVPQITFNDEALIPIWEKVKSEERLSFEDGLTLVSKRALAMQKACEL